MNHGGKLETQRWSIAADHPRFRQILFSHTTLHYTLLGEGASQPQVAGENDALQRYQVFAVDCCFPKCLCLFWLSGFRMLVSLQVTFFKTTYDF